MKVRITDESLDEMVRAGLLPEEAAAELRSMWQANVATSTSGYAGGGGGSGSNAHHAVAASGTNGQGGGGGQMFTCRCGLPAIIHTGALAECQGCFRQRTMAVKYAYVKESFYNTPSPLMCACGKVATRLNGFNTKGCTPMCRECDMIRLANAKPEPPPEPTHCACGASFATVKRIVTVGWSSRIDECGDCVMRHSDKTPLDARIRAAREGRDEDPTTWTAGATPGWEWP